MIDHNPTGFDDLCEQIVAFVRSESGRLIGIFWGDRHEICHAIDEITDPNGCEFRECCPAGVRFACYHEDEEISVEEYATSRRSFDQVGDVPSDEESSSNEEEQELTADDFADEFDATPIVVFEGFSDMCLDSIDTADTEQWRLLVPPGYVYTAGIGLQKVEADWN